MSDWSDQLARANRYYGKFKQLNDGMEHRSPSEFYMDDIYSFFQHCYHVKDYLKNDPTFTKHTNQQIEDHVTNTPALAICADICNGSKHLLLQKRRSGDEPKFGKKTITIAFTDTINFSGGPPPKEEPVTIKMQIEVEHNGNKLDGFQIATDAMNAWNAFTV